MKSPILRLIVSIMLLSLLVSGCTLFPTSTVNKKGGLNVSINLGTPRGALDTLTLKGMAVTLTQGSTTLSGSTAIVAGNATVSFSDLQVGTWNVAVVVTDMGDIAVYDGATTVGVTSGPASVAVTVPMTPKVGDLSVTAAIPSGLGITNGTAVLISGTTTPPTPRDFTSGNAATFIGLKCTSWTLKVSLKDAGGVVKAYGQKTIDLLPGRVTPVALSVADYETGTAEISMPIKAEPTAPTGVQAVRDASGVTVSWTRPTDVSALAGYAVYRSETETGIQKLLNETLVPAGDSSYRDATTVVSKACYYRVRVYDSNGLSSDLSAFHRVGAVPEYKDFTIRGKVTGDGVHTVLGFRAMLCMNGRAIDPQHPTEVTVGADGTYEFPTLNLRCPDGSTEYAILFTPLQTSENFYVHTVTVPRNMGYDDPAIVSVPDVTMETGGCVKVTLHDVNGTPVANASVYVSIGWIDGPSSGNDSYATLTNNDGVFWVGARPGRVTVTADTASYGKGESPAMTITDHAVNTVTIEISQ